MLTVISPAKTLDFKSPPKTNIYTVPDFIEESAKLTEKLRKLKPGKLAELMNISASLASLNYDRYQKWHLPFTPENAKQAVLAFNGDVYTGLKASTLSEKKLVASQQKLRILSGLYGELRPLDLIQPYRLEMGTSFGAGRSRDLYAFWRKKVTAKIQDAIEESGSRVLVNLASNEYFKVIDHKKLNAEIVTPTFKEMKNGDYKVISIFAKKARGLMTRFILENDMDDPTDLQAFDLDGYQYNPRLSKPGNPVFSRG
jgi:uncharacterized protein